MKKIVKLLLAAVLGVTIVAPMASCGKKCNHNVGTWEIITEATCQTAGSRKGICGVCLAEITEEIPADPYAHVYGDWQISVPTDTETGSATAVCTLDGRHTPLYETLPVLSSTDYRSEVSKRPTVTEDGEWKYTLRNTEKDIIFTVPIAREEMTVRDAAGLGGHEDSRQLVRSAKGSMAWEYRDEDNKLVGGKHTGAHSYEFGENYTYIKDGTDNCQRWYFIDEQTGETYGLTDRNGGGKIIDDLLDASSSERYLQGTRMYFQYAAGLGYYYGVEELLEGLYRSARWSANGDFREWIEEDEDGNKTYCFFFGSPENSGKVSGYFANVTTKFTLTENYVVNDIWTQAVVYTNSNSSKTWEYNDQGYAEIKDGQEKGIRYICTIEMEQKMKVEGEQVPQNPHPLEKVFVQSFDIAYDEEVLTDGVLADGRKAEFASGKVTDYLFQIINVSPSEAVEDYTLDAFHFFLRTTEDGKTVDIPIDSLSMSTVGMSVYMRNSDKKFFLNAKRSGEQTVVVKTSTGIERVIHCRIGATKPTAIYPAIYEYKNGEYAWSRGEEMEQTTLSKTVYVNQPLYFNIDVPSEEKRYAYSTYAVLQNGQEVDMTSKGSNFTATAMDGEPVTQFIAKEAGSYVIQIASKYIREDGSYVIHNDVACVIRVTVVEAPKFADMIEKSYKGNVEYPSPAKACITFGSSETSKNDNNEDIITVDAAITVEGMGTEILKCTYNLVAGTLETEYLEGTTELPSAKLGFSLGLNEAYDLILSHYLAEFDTTESVLLTEHTPRNNIEEIARKTYVGEFEGETPVAVSLTLTTPETKNFGGTWTATATLTVGDKTEEFACTYTLVDGQIALVSTATETLGYEVKYENEDEAFVLKYRDENYAQRQLILTTQA